MMDGQASEAFLQSVAVELSDVAIIVVTALTLTDQQYILKFMEKLKAMKHGPKNVIVVHNLMLVKEIADAEKQIKRDIVKCLGASKAEAKRCATCKEDEFHTYWKGKKIIDGPTVTHVVIAEDGTPAGNRYNDQTVDWLHRKLSMLQSEVADERRENIFDRFLKYSAYWLPKVFINHTDVDKACVRMNTNKEPFRIGLCEFPAEGLQYRPGLKIVDGNVDVAGTGGKCSPVYDQYSNDTMTIVMVDLQGVSPGNVEALAVHRDEQEVIWYDRNKPEAFTVTLQKSRVSQYEPPSLTVSGFRLQPDWLLRSKRQLDLQHIGTAHGHCKLPISLEDQRMTDMRVQWEKGVLTIFLDHYIKRALSSRSSGPAATAASTGVQELSTTTAKEATEGGGTSTATEKNNTFKFDL